MTKQGPVRRIVVDRVQPARDTTIAGMPHDDRRFAEQVKNAGGRKQLQLDFIVGVCSWRDQTVHDVVPHAQINCAFCIRLRWSDVVCNFYDSLGFARAGRRKPDAGLSASNRDSGTGRTHRRASSSRCSITWPCSSKRQTGFPDLRARSKAYTGVPSSDGSDQVVHVRAKGLATPRAGPRDHPYGAVSVDAEES